MKKKKVPEWYENILMQHIIK